jgi:hypothetical protein
MYDGIGSEGDVMSAVDLIDRKFSTIRVDHRIATGALGLLWREGP